MFKVVTKNAIEKTEVQVEAVVGSQTITAPKLEFEVYDCSVAMVFAESPRQQLDDS